MIATEATVNDIVTELSAYVTDVNADISRKSIAAISKIAIKIPSSCVNIVRQLFGFLSLNIDYVITETLVAMKDLIRKYADLSLEILVNIENYLEIASDDEGKAAIVWMIGEFGEEITDAPYIIENITSTVNLNDNIEIAHALLSATVKLFLKRAPEMIGVLSSLYEKLYSECENPDVLDRAGFYYRLLEHDPFTASEILNCEKHPIYNFLEDSSTDVQDTLLQEFNQLSVLYQKPAKHIVKPKPELTIPEKEADPQQVSDLLSLDSVNLTEDVLKLDEDFVMDSDAYQEAWSEIPECFTDKKRLSRYINIEEVEKIMGKAHINCIASGDNVGVLKFFFYAKDAKSDNLVLLGIEITSASKDVSLSVKCNNSDIAEKFKVVLGRETSSFLQM